jgi:hypothetical protein
MHCSADHRRFVTDANHHTSVNNQAHHWQTPFCISRLCPLSYSFRTRAYKEIFERPSSHIRTSTCKSNSLRVPYRNREGLTNLALSLSREQWRFSHLIPLEWTNSKNQRMNSSEFSMDLKCIQISKLDVFPRTSMSYSTKIIFSRSQSSMILGWHCVFSVWSSWSALFNEIIWIRGMWPQSPAWWWWWWLPLQNGAVGIRNCGSMSKCHSCHIHRHKYALFSKLCYVNETTEPLT